MDSVIFTVVLITALLLLAAVCSGLNIAVMSLDLAELKRKARLGDKHARRVLPLRKNVHLLLGSILFTNVAAASATAIVLGDVLNGFVAGILSTFLLVIVGEIFPQALFSKHALLWSSRFAPLLKLMIVITYPASKPLQHILDKIFPATGRPLHTRGELGLMIAEHTSTESELDEDEVEIIRGALQLSEKRVRDIVTPIEDVYWLTPETRLDDPRIDEVKARGFSRIPIFNQQLTKCYGVMLMKELVDIDFDHNEYTVSDMTLYPTQLVGSMTALDTMFRKFISARTHLIPIEKDDKIIGVSTIEDLLEEILGHEIEDESDRMREQNAAN